ncbi:B3 domain-containing transcription factor VRN1-like [Ziziphus jujuba]|uniref:B3 domain-containing transcription factor VRN1-like n=1 Tax=Ziziphus jujuba TaxID=326968 RepID=A0ABM4A1Y5_ZIZJJ|nr:B3 domain-containing transcription factor VRN1-like [Ziziphus jujuba]
MSTFCKIVLQQSLQDLKLMLPEEFVSKFERNLPDFAFFELPNGWIWKLRLQKRNGDVYLSLRDDEESVDFASYYSLQQGNVIFFKYDGNANFDVQIFDVNGDEINYDPTFSTTTSSSVEENGDDDDDSVIIST